MTESNVKPIKTYDYPYYCENCKQHITIKIPFGQLALDYICACPICGINQQQVREWVQREYGNGQAAQVLTSGIKSN